MVMFTLVHAMKAQKGSGGIAVLFLQPRHWMWGGVGQRHGPAALPSGKRRLDGPQGQSGNVRKISVPIGIQSPNHSVAA